MLKKYNSTNTYADLAFDEENGALFQIPTYLEEKSIAGGEVGFHRSIREHI